MKKPLFTLIILASALMGGAQVPCWDGTIAETYAGGDGTLDNPYQIATPEQLALLAEQTNTSVGGDAYYILTEDLCLNGSQNFEWEPIGNASWPFTGLFNGNGHIISDMYMVDLVNSGLFGFTQGAVIKDVEIEDANIPYGAYPISYIGLVVGHAKNTNIYNCNTNGLVGDCMESCGGLVGLFSADAVDETFVIKDCVNHAVVESGAFRGGGIVGKTTITNGQILIEGCVNYGSLNVWGANGGIVGEGTSIIKGCDNYGTIISTYDGITSAGGIAGQTTQTSVIEDCINHESGEIRALTAGGIVGHSMNAVISRCGNKAQVKGQNHNFNLVEAGGIAGSDGRISNCFNTGGVSAENKNRAIVQMGGITGVVGSEGYVRNCYNTGAVIRPNMGGWYAIICPVESTSLSNCYWYGDYNLPPSQTPSQVIEASGPFGSGPTNTSWTLEEAQYGTTDLLEALNRGSMGECLWVEDVDGVNGGFPIPTEDESIYPLYGNEWYYEIVNANGSITYQHLEFAANDTTIHHKDVVIIIKTNTLYDKGYEYQEVTHEYIYQEDNVVYWYNKLLDEFTVLYDFGAVADDEWEISVAEETVLMHVDSVAFVAYGGETYRKMMVVSDNDGVFSGEILCGVGHTTSFFPENLMNKDYRVEGIRCYWNGNVLIQQWSNADCDEVYEQFHTGLEEPIVDEKFRVYPNPTEGLLNVETVHAPSLQAQNNEYCITNIMGQTLIIGQIDGENTQINVKSLPQGLYFITVGSATQPFIKK